VLADRLDVGRQGPAAVALDLLGERLDGTRGLLRGTGQRATQFSWYVIRSWS
jgi:hypothetical protein